MADTADFVDEIRHGMQQRGHRPPRKIIGKPEMKEERRLSNWPPGRLAERLGKLLPWREDLEGCQFKD